MALEQEKKSISTVYTEEQLQKMSMEINNIKKFLEKEANNIDNNLRSHFDKMLCKLETIYYKEMINKEHEKLYATALKDFKRRTIKVNSISKLLENEIDTINNNTIFYLKELLHKENKCISSLKEVLCKLSVDKCYNINYFEIIYNAYGNNDRMFFNQAILPCPINLQDKVTFALEFEDILLPYLIENMSKYFWGGEGPYEMKDYVCLNQGDVVMDCGANMGLFSAVASTKGCRVYAFEPMEYTINNYLSKTADWNKNITICPYALSDKKQTVVFKLRRGSIEGSRQVKENKGTDEDCQEVQAITLDEFVLQNKIGKVDFIKADIEGAERYMLAGAKDTIKEFCPKISICKYHLPDDPKVLREMLLDIQPKYKIEEKHLKMYAYV